MPRLRLFLLFVLVCASATPCWAESDSHRLLQAAQSDWQDQEYERVIKRAEAVLKHPTSSKKERLKALQMMGAAMAVLDQKQQAAKIFEQMLRLDPRAELPSNTSPRILSVYLPTRSLWELRRETELRDTLGATLQSLQFSVHPPKGAQGGREIPFLVRLTDPNRLAAEITIQYRRTGSKTFSNISAAAHSSPQVLSIPGAFTESSSPYKLEYFVQIRHSSGIALGKFGTRKTPQTLSVRPGRVPKPPRIYHRWWFWASATVAAVTIPILIDQARDVGPQVIRGQKAP